MRGRSRHRWYGLLGVALLATASAQAPLIRIADLPLPGPTGRFDYAAFDPHRGTLWLNQMGVDRTLVFDPATQRVVAVIDGLSTPTGITLAPKRRLGFISEAGELLARVAGHGHVAVVKLDTHEIVAQLPAGHFPDGSAWVPEAGRLFVSNELGGTETVIGGTPLRLEKTIDLGGEAGMSAYDPLKRQVLVNVQTRDEIIAINPRRLAIVHRIKLPTSCEHNHGLLIDADDRLAFVACDGNARLLALSLDNLKPVQTALQVGNDPDVLALDAAHHALVVAAESGVVAVFSITADRLHPLWRGFVGTDAHVVAIDPASDWLYFPLNELRGTPMLRIEKLDDTPLPMRG